MFSFRLLLCVLPLEPTPHQQINHLEFRARANGIQWRAREG